MLFLADTNDKFQITTDSAANLDVYASYADNASGTITFGKQLTAISSATTTDVLAAPGASTVRNLRTLMASNRHASTSNTVTVILDDNGTDYTLFKTVLRTGETLSYTEQTGWFVYRSTAKEEYNLIVTGDVTNATTSWADVTGLTCPVKSGKSYFFEANLMYICNATTTGARFGCNGPAATHFRANGWGTVTGSVTAAALSAPTAAVTAYDTAANGAQTTGPATEVSALMIGTLVPSADGTLAVRCQSEIAVASALIVRRGSSFRVREADNA